MNDVRTQNEHEASIGETAISVVPPFSEDGDQAQAITPLQLEGTKGLNRSGSDTFPEGGQRAWANVLGSFFVVFITQGTIYSFGVFQDFYTRIYLPNLSPSKIAWIGSVQVFLLFSLALPTGKLFDEGYFRPLMFTGSTIYIFSYFMLSLAKPHQFYQVFLAQGVGVGIGMGLIYVPSISTCFHYFRRRRALASGIASLGGAVGAIVQTIGLNHLLNGRVGFAWTVRIFGFISLALVIAGNLLIRPRLPSRRLRKDNAPTANIKRVAGDVSFSIAIIGASLLLFAIYFPFFYVQLFAILHGISTNLAFYSITILNGATIIGRLAMGALADKYGALNTFTIGCSLLGIVSFTMIKATNAAGLALFAIFYGILSGGSISLAGPFVLAYVDNISDFGFAFGYVSFIQSFFTLIAAPVAGQILNAPQYKWNRATIIVSSLIYAGVLFLVVSRVLLMKRKKALWI